MSMSAPRSTRWSARCQSSARSASWSTPMTAAATSRIATSGPFTRNARSRASRSRSTPRAAIRSTRSGISRISCRSTPARMRPEQLLACTAVIYSGLLETYQDLRVAFLEAGIGWVPFWMEHMDEEYEFRRFEAPLLKMKPSEYMACGRVYVSCEPEEKTLRYVPDFFPEENILFASDYPHWDGEFPYAVAHLANRNDLSAEFKQKIFRDNPRRFYGLAD
ncbi:MAG: amidohydrolase [Alphaproteobacteria bacterium]|nr:MAG: amidohydrolase [Alphaproteobacteria bacterium]